MGITLIAWSRSTAMARTRLLAAVLGATALLAREQSFVSPRAAAAAAVAGGLPLAASALPPAPSGVNTLPEAQQAGIVAACGHQDEVELAES